MRMSLFENSFPHDLVDFVIQISSYYLESAPFDKFSILIINYLLSSCIQLVVNLEYFFNFSLGIR